MLDVVNKPQPFSVLTGFRAQGLNAAAASQGSDIRCTTQSATPVFSGRQWPYPLLWKRCEVCPNTSLFLTYVDMTFSHGCENFSFPKP